jgi:hypothetical protein
MAYIFQQIADNATIKYYSQDQTEQSSRDWYRNTAAAVKTVNTVKMMNDKQNIVSKLDINSIGKMYMFFYDPKLKATLPYYDTFPLVFPIDFKENGFLGINLHYLPPYLRAKLMDNLYKTANNTKYDNSTKLKISYQTLNSSSQLSYFKPCLKMYLWDHVVGSNYLNVETKNWDAALMLPTERFKKASKETVFKDSVRATR